MTADKLHTLGRRYSLRNLLRSLAIENSEGQHRVCVRSQRETRIEMAKSERRVSLEWNERNFLSLTGVAP